MAIRWAALTAAMYLALTGAAPAFAATTPSGRLAPSPPVALGPAAPSGASHASATGSPAAAPAAHSTGGLPHTGIDVPQLALGGVALVLLGAGLELLALPRRLRRTE